MADRNMTDKLLAFAGDKLKTFINKKTGIAASARGSSSSLSLAANAITKLTLNTWITRVDTKFVFSGGGIKCPYAGKVLITGSVYISTGGATCGAYVYKNNVEITSQYHQQAAASVCAGAIVISVAAGDVITLRARSSVAGTCTPNVATTHLDIVYL